MEYIPIFVLCILARISVYILSITDQSWYVPFHCRVAVGTFGFIDYNSSSLAILIISIIVQKRNPPIAAMMSKITANVFNIFFNIDILLSYACVSWSHFLNRSGLDIAHKKYDIYSIHKANIMSSATPDQRNIMKTPDDIALRVIFNL